MDDKEFLLAFEAATLPRSLWTHEAHLRMVYLYLVSGEPLDVLTPRVREHITCYNLAHGNRTGYHDTITIAFLRLVKYRLEVSPADTFETFKEANPDLFASSKEVLLNFYEATTLFSPEARARFVEPDIAPLP